MRDVAEKLYVGTVRDVVPIGPPEWSLVSATQTIHYPLLGWDRKFNKPDQSHPNYIVLEQEHHLSLNWVDGPARLYRWSGPATFQRVLDFIDRELSGDRNVLIRCDQGYSRSPSIALLYLAKRQHRIPSESFLTARAAFEGIYPGYQPGGIADYLNEVWSEIT